MLWACCRAQDSCTTRPEEMTANNIKLKWSKATKISVKHGQFAEFDCKAKNYANDGTTPFRVQCNNGVLKYPNCVRGQMCSTSPEEMAKNNITFRWSKKPMLYGDEAEVIEFQCKSYAYTNDETVPFRVQCIKGEITYPVCIKIGPCMVSPKERDDHNLELSSKQRGKVSFEFDERINFVCKDGHRAPKDKPLSVKCTKDGVDFPTCINEKPCTASTENMGKNNVKLKWVERDEIHSKHEQWIEFECISNEYVEDNTTPFRIQCYQGEIKYPRCIKTGKEQKCGAAPTISKGDITEKREESYISGAVVEYKCQESFKIRGPRKVTCQSGTWSESPECTA